MKTSDPVLEEVWKARDEHARRFGYDLKKICADLRRIEKESGKLIAVGRYTFPKKQQVRAGQPLQQPGVQIKPVGICKTGYQQDQACHQKTC